MIISRSQMARVAHRMGVTSLIAAVAQSPSLIVLCYHRIGHRHDDCYDPHLYSATGEEFDDQVGYLKRVYGIATVDEVLHEFGTRSWKGARILLTFDDGYLDNYTTAFPILRAHGVQATFLLATDFVGTTRIPWWDAIGHMISETPERYIRIPSLTTQVFDKHVDGPAPVMRRVLRLFRSTNQPHPYEVIKDLELTTGISCSAASFRRFINWNEALEMRATGMEIGAHSASHRLLGCLPPEEQRHEIAECGDRMLQEIGAPPRVFALPCGNASPETTTLIRAAGYGLSLSTEHGANRIESWDPFNVRRVQVNHFDVKEISRLRLALMSSGARV
jgi:peptidoglycan/xylan/chitin deacetylase (PgdA/CDA1 family)